MKKLRGKPAVIVKEQNNDALVALMRSEYLSGVNFAITKILEYLDEFPNHNRGEIKQSLKTMRELANQLVPVSKEVE